MYMVMDLLDVYGNGFVRCIRWWMCYIHTVVDLLDAYGSGIVRCIM